MATQRKGKSKYRDGAEGMIRWCEDYVYVPIYPPHSDVPVWTPMRSLPTEPDPETGKSYRDMWEAQKEVLRECLVMEGRRFKYKVIVFCWPRGDGKSLVAVLVQMWKFFCWNRQQIMLGANSRDQVKFVHLDIIKDIILHSPPLLRVVTAKNVQDKQVLLRAGGSKVVTSMIRAISSFSGIVSNITGYTFSEIFDMKNPKFFVQLDGSTRNIPNALGVIDSTVSAKQHILYQLYEGARLGKTEQVYFSYRYSREGKVEDYWNPHMNERQLEDYRVKFPFGEFERYFLNLWSAGVEQVFSEEMIEGWEYLGVDGEMGRGREVLRVLEEKNRVEMQIKEMRDVKQLPEALGPMEEKIEECYSRLIPMERLYTMQAGAFGRLCLPPLETLHDLTERFDTDWCVGVGFDRADPMKIRSNARTILSCVAKGLPRSRSDPFFYAYDAVPEYLYLLLFLAHIESSSIEDAKALLTDINAEYDGVDVICGERWGMWDLAEWCEENDINADIIYPTYDRQKEAFSEFYIPVRQGRFKSPPVPVPGSKEENILAEEARVFYHDPEKRWFGSPEKQEKYGIQDDTMFSVAWAMYGMRTMGVDSFRSRKLMRHFGVMLENRDLIGKW